MKKKNLKKEIEEMLYTEMEVAGVDVSIPYRREKLLCLFLGWALECVGEDLMVYDNDEPNPFALTCEMEGINHAKKEIRERIKQAALPQL